MPTELPQKVSFIEVDPEAEGQRLDNFLMRRLKGVPKSLIYRIIRKGEVRVNKGRVKQTTRLQAGDIVRVPPLQRAVSVAPKVSGKYAFLLDCVLFEDDVLLVIDKPSGLAVHAGSGISVGVIEAMRSLRPDLKYLELAHRLDRATSGCLVLAKKAAALRTLNDDFKNNSLRNPRLDKRYLALVKGRWRHGERRVTKALNTEARRAGERHVMVEESGSYASSIFTPVVCNDQASLIEVKLLTGRTHQVRVHAAAENHPLAGDERYGDADFNSSMKQFGLNRLFLHAAKLAVHHPISGARLEFSAALPHVLVGVLEKIGLTMPPDDR
ncbi:MAG: RluA family pseudouridine synthase [Gammaproteobacteria bacterium]|nr:RluA family pseudouridine synthase [Gammaproteobacteria bacterium]